MIKRYKKNWITLSVLLLSFITVQAQPKPSMLGTDEISISKYILGFVAIVLAFVIAILGNAVKVAGKQFVQKKLAEEAALTNEKSAIPKLLSILVFVLLYTQVNAQADIAKVTTSETHWDLYAIFSVIILEFIIILVLVRALLVFWDIKIGFFSLSKPLQNIQHVQEVVSKKRKGFFERINQTVTIEEEASLDMSHNYDGIRELDNKVPSWWKMAFVCSILFGVVYVFRMFISESLPTQEQELAVANEQAEVHKAEYLKKAADNVDENTVKLLDKSAIENGSTIYSKNCVACHGDKGQGGVGPNLTDDYWLHKGSLRDIFYSVKYGWPEKGMKSWKEDLTPSQIAQVANFIKTLHGTNPPNPKDKQGELFLDQTTTDTSHQVLDSLKGKNISAKLK